MPMTDEEFAQKVSWEGGILDALLEYGLSCDDLEDTEGALYSAIAEFDSIRLQLQDILGAIEEALPETEEF